MEIIPFPGKHAENPSLSEERLRAAKEAVRDHNVRRHLEEIIELTTQAPADNCEIVPDIEMAPDGKSGHIVIDLVPLSWKASRIKVNLIDEYFTVDLAKAPTDAYPGETNIRDRYAKALGEIVKTMGNYALHKQWDGMEGSDEKTLKTQRERSEGKAA